MGVKCKGPDPSAAPENASRAPSGRAARAATSCRWRTGRCGRRRRVGGVRAPGRCGSSPVLRDTSSCATTSSLAWTSASHVRAATITRCPQSTGRHCGWSVQKTPLRSAWSASTGPHAWAGARWSLKLASGCSPTCSTTRRRRAPLGSSGAPRVRACRAACAAQAGAGCSALSAWQAMLRQARHAHAAASSTRSPHAWPRSGWCPPC
mmetsp:Transcript_16525/g.39529  ORF Transcript_16525/g.39529 Transcript_16525/m.39529 type:complete len:207 (+) Transcript_16525:1707-2327(+)